jgi:peptidoglycan/xylan/chitin deacetylase (PgdA/CDA1 family)
MAHKELFVHLSDVEALVRNLKEEGYRFALPGDIRQSDGPVCSLTFDDGYFNNHSFLEVAEKYDIPFILFLTSYNVIHGLPFIWDIWEATRTEKWPISSADYRKLYESLNRNERELLYNDSHRPFTQDELGTFAAHPLVHLAPHGHTHQPMVGKYLKRIDPEIDNNLTFLAKYGNTLKDDFSLPCGLYTGRSQKRLLTRFDRIYTIDGGGFSPDDRVINRISLINPDFGGPLREQIKQSFGLKRRLLRKALNIRYSSSLFYRIGF